MFSVQVAVALAKKIKLSEAIEEGKAAEAFAQSLMDSWGVGDAHCNDGVILLLSQDPRQVIIGLLLPSTQRFLCYLV